MLETTKQQSEGRSKTPKRTPSSFPPKKKKTKKQIKQIDFQFFQSSSANQAGKSSNEEETCTARRRRILLEILELFQDPLRSHHQNPKELNLCRSSRVENRRERRKNQRNEYTKKNTSSEEKKGIELSPWDPPACLLFCLREERIYNYLQIHFIYSKKYIYKNEINRERERKRVGAV